MQDVVLDTKRCQCEQNDSPWGQGLNTLLLKYSYNKCVVKVQRPRKIPWGGPGAVAHLYNPRCLGGRDLRDHSLRPAHAES
jgi:hypothetical protein